MTNNSFLEFFRILSIVSKRRPFKADFNLGNRKKRPLESNLESRMAGVQRSFRFSPENCAVFAVICPGRVRPEFASDQNSVRSVSVGRHKWLRLWNASSFSITCVVMREQSDTKSFERGTFLPTVSAQNGCASSDSGKLTVALHLFQNRNCFWHSWFHAS